MTNAATFFSPIIQKNFVIHESSQLFEKETTKYVLYIHVPSFSTLSSRGHNSSHSPGPVSKVPHLFFVNSSHIRLHPKHPGSIPSFRTRSNDASSASSYDLCWPCYRMAIAPGWGCSNTALLAMLKNWGTNGHANGWLCCVHNIQFWWLLSSSNFHFDFHCFGEPSKDGRSDE